MGMLPIYPIDDIVRVADILGKKSPGNETYGINGYAASLYRDEFAVKIG